MGAWRAYAARGVVWCVWLYVVLLAAVWLVILAGGDRWWLPTVMLFGPRWPYALPLVVLALGVVLFHRSMIRHLLAAALIVFGLMMGFCLPLARLTAPGDNVVRVLTCNVKGRCCDNKMLDNLVRTASPDLVALQGCWGQVRIVWPEGWHVRQQGELLVASRYPLGDDRVSHRHHPPKQWPRPNIMSCLVAAPFGEFRFCAIRLESPHEGIDQLLDRQTLLAPSRSPALELEIENRWLESADAAEWLGEFSEPLIIAGDFNMPSDSPMYRRFWAQYSNAFAAAGLGFGYSEWPRVRKLLFGIRIDHILSSPGWRPATCWVGPDIGSDHLPVIADLSWDKPPDEAR